MYQNTSIFVNIWNVGATGSVRDVCVDYSWKRALERYIMRGTSIKLSILKKIPRILLVMQYIYNITFGNVMFLMNSFYSEYLWLNGLILFHYYFSKLLLHTGISYAYVYIGRKQFAIKFHRNSSLGIRGTRQYLNKLK